MIIIFISDAAIFTTVSCVVTMLQKSSLSMVECNTLTGKSIFVVIGLNLTVTPNIFCRVLNHWVEKCRTWVIYFHYKWNEITTSNTCAQQLEHLAFAPYSILNDTFQSTFL